MKLSLEDIYAWDENAAWLGMDLDILMENAGSAVARAIHQRYGYDEKGNRRRLNIAVICGTGNNGGDGFVAARHLSSFHNVTVFAFGRPERIRTDAARKNFNLIAASPFIRLFILDDQETMQKLDLAPYDLIVDALLGAGKKGDIREPYATLIERINAFRGRSILVSIDVPSGYPGKRHVMAHHTYTFEWDKKEYDFPREILPIGYPPELYHLIGPFEARKLLKKRGMKKGDHGNLLIIGGSSRYPGAPLLSARAALPFVDRVIVATSSKTPVPFSPSMIPVLIADDHFTLRAFESIEPHLDQVDAIVLGPGLGRAEETMTFVHTLLRQWNGPLVIDADALYALPTFPPTELKSQQCLLTPHRGEMRMLFEKLLGGHMAMHHTLDDSNHTELENRQMRQNVEKILFNDLLTESKSIQSIAHMLQCTILRKGPYDLIVPKKGDRFRYNITGTRALTTAGTGDMLAGLSGALLTRGAAPEVAGGVATFLLGLTSEYLSPTYDDLIPIDVLLESLPIVSGKLLQHPIFLKRTPDGQSTNV
ncbi:MAG: NAD(P)H-hydrate dehydratase [Candidatus Carbobacillus sp.]|nr:NAD(P)H-hydrate dehydratase [Candidatus Carbobacillus sp.]